MTMTNPIQAAYDAFQDSDRPRKKPSAPGPARSSEPPKPPVDVTEAEFMADPERILELAEEHDRVVVVDEFGVVCTIKHRG